MPEHKCAFGDEITRITIKPDGANELDPCLYEEIETYKKRHRPRSALRPVRAYRGGMGAAGKYN